MEIELKLPSAASGHFAESLVSSVGAPVSQFAAIRVPPMLIKRRIVFGMTGHNVPSGVFRVTAVFTLGGQIVFQYGADSPWPGPVFPATPGPIVYREFPDIQVRDPSEIAPANLRGIVDIVNVNCDTIFLVVELKSSGAVTGNFVQVLRATSSLPF